MKKYATSPAMAFFPSDYVSPQPFIESGGVTVTELFKWHARKNPSIDVFRYYTGNSVEGLTYSDFDKGILRAARLVSSVVGPSSRDRHVIAVFAIAGTPAQSHLTRKLPVLRDSFQTPLPIPPSS